MRLLPFSSRRASLAGALLKMMKFSLEYEVAEAAAGFGRLIRRHKTKAMRARPRRLDVDFWLFVCSPVHLLACYPS